MLRVGAPFGDGSDDARYQSLKNRGYLAKRDSDGATVTNGRLYLHRGPNLPEAAMVRSMEQTEMNANYKHFVQMFLVLILVAGSGCATLTNDPLQRIEFIAPSCEAEQKVQCTAKNKRGSWDFDPPATVGIRRSDDVLNIHCRSEDGENYSQSIASRMGGKIIASAVFLDLGITDAITDKHREYPAQIVLTACH